MKSDKSELCRALKISSVPKLETESLLLLPKMNKNPMASRRSSIADVDYGIKGLEKFKQ